MSLRRIGALIAIVVLLFALARVSGLVVDWAWFSSIGYAGVFWTTFAAKATLFAIVFAVSTGLLWANATLALRFSSGSPLKLPAVFSPSVVTFLSAQGPWAQPRQDPAFPAQVATRHPGRRRHTRTADRLGREQPVGARPPVPPSGALRPGRTAVRQGHRLLPLLAAGLCRVQELALLAPGALRHHGRRDLFRARPRQPRSSALELRPRGGRPRLGAHRPLLPGEGVGLCAGPLPPAL